MPTTLVEFETSLLRKHMPELDVLRGLAILMVVAFHGLYWSGATSTSPLVSLVIRSTAFGWLGVNLFFVLSGFLITGILLDTKHKRRYYQTFYRRRALRILPAYLATIAVLYFTRSIGRMDLLPYLGFYANYVLVSYGPFWSLSVEEQFYLLWPTVVKRISVHALLWVCLALCIVEPGLRLFSVTHNNILGSSRGATYLIADNLALGGLAAIFARSQYGSLRSGVRVGCTLCAVGLSIFIAGYPFGILHRTNAVGSAFQTVPWNLCFAGLLLLCLGLRSPWFTSAWAKPLTFLGYISYGLYLIHGFVFGVYYRFAPVNRPLVGFAVGAGASVMIAWVSRRFYEEPWLRAQHGSR